MQFFTSSEVELIGLTDNQKREIEDALNWFHKDMGKQIQELLKKSDYGDAVKELSVIPTIYSKRYLGEIEKKTGKPFPERRIFRAKTGETDFRLRIDHEQFLGSDFTEKKKMLLDNVLQSITDLGAILKSEQFNATQLKHDLARIFVNL